MNHVFRIVWSKALGTWVVASESTARRGKSSGDTRRCQALLAGVGIATLAICGWSSPAGAQTWTGATSSDWTVGSNWSTGTVPTGNVTINTSTPNPTVLGVSGPATATMGILTMGATASGTSVLTIQNGSTLTSVAAGTNVIGQANGANATITVTGLGSAWSTAGSTIMGNGSGATATLNIANGAAVSIANSLTLGQSGVVSGNAVLNITSGGTLTTTGNATMFRRGGNSTANVSGAGSQWSVGGSLMVGTGATGGSSGISVLNVDNGGVVTVAGPVGIGGASLSTRGLGTITVTGAGSQLSSGGALNIGQWGTGTLTVSNGAVATANTVTLGASASGSGTLNLVGGSTLASQALTGGSGLMRQVNFDGGTLRATASNTAFISGFSGTELNVAAGGLTLDTAGFDVTAASPFSGVGALTKTGLGTAVLTGDNSYTGGTTISAGTLQLGNGGSSGSITGDVTNNGTLAFNRSDAYTHGGRISGTGAVRQIGTGTTILTGNNTYTGGTAIDDGTLQVAGDANLGDASGGLTLDGGALRNTAAFASARTVTLGTNGGTLETQADLTLSGTIGGTGSLTKNGGSTLTLTGNNTYAGGTSINGGTVAVSGDANLGNATGALSLDGGTLQSTAALTSARAVTLNAGGGTFQTTGDLTLTGAVGGSGALTKTDAGTLLLAANNTYAGGTTISAGTLQLGNGSGSGSITGDVTNNGTLAFNRSDAYTYGGQISGTGAVRQIGTGTTILTGDNIYTGGTVIDGGTLQVASDANLGDASGPLSFNGGTLQNTATFGSARAVTLGAGGGSFQTDADLALSGVIGGTGALTKTGAGTLTLSSANTYTGGTTISAGTLQIGSGGTSGSITGDVTNNGTLALDRSDRLDFDGAISGTGAIRQIGSGFTNLSGNSAAFAGTTTVEAGTLAVNGVLGGSTNVLAAGRLQGSGTVGSLTVAGTVAPGNSIGTLHVNGNFTQAAGSTYQVEVDPASTASDLIHATGSASIASGANLQVVRTSSASYSLGNRYTVLTADGGVTGTYSLKGDTQSAFVQLVDSYDANHVYLSAEKVRSFTDAAGTPNQVAVSTALESLPDDHGLVKAVAWLPSDFAARDAFNQLSVDIHASSKTAMLEDSRFVREAAIDRLRTATCAPGSAPQQPQQPVQGSQGEGCTPADNQARTAWGQVFGSWGHIDGDGNAAKLKRDIGGFVVGADTGVGAGWRAGALGGYSRASADTDARNSSAKTDSYHLGLYGSTQWGATALRLGAGQSWNKTETSRSVAFAGFADSLSAKYDSTTTQLFGEVGHRIDAGAVALEPFAGLAHVRVKSDAFFERGGLAALYGDGGSVDATFSTLGVRASMQLGESTRVRGLLGWRHAFGDTTPTSTHAFAGSLPFTIAGVPLAKNVAVLEAGVETQLRPNLKLGASYAGQFGNGLQDHGFKVNLNWAF